ncbi:MAG: DUF4870 domain-containing protein [Clostridiales bacterium]|nr:DUF4870 domain-containing protein [Clostridiales bacterium]
MVQIRKNVIHALMYLLSFLLPLSVIFGGKDVEEDTRYQSVQALLLQVLQLIVAIVLGLLTFVLRLCAAFTANGYLSIMSGALYGISGVLSAIPWIFQAGLVLLAVLAFFDKTFRLPFIDSLTNRITPKIYRDSRHHSDPGT